MSNLKSDTNYLLSDGLHLLKIFREYVTFTSAINNQYQEINCSAMNCVLAETTLRSNVKAILRTFNLLILSLRSSATEYPKCDVVLFNSSNKPSFGPAITNLAERLAKKGFRCAMLSYEKINLMGPEDFRSNYPLTGFYRSNNFITALSSIARGTYVLLKVLLQTASSPLIFSHIVKRIIPTWQELIFSYNRSKEASAFLKQSSPQLIITHIEKIPIAHELVMAATRQSIPTVLFLCEHPDVLTQPICSQEVWVWNEKIASSIIREVIQFEGKQNKKIFVVGHHESDYIMSKDKISLLDLGLPINQPTGQKIFIFISEYVENKTWKRGPITKACVHWLRVAADQLPDWLFVFKTRPYQSQTSVPGFNEATCQNPQNLILYQGDKGLPDFFASGSVVAAGALGSLGLFASAHCGIPSFRFVISEPNMPMEFLEEFAVVVRSPSELVSALQSIEVHQNQLTEKISKLPYRGKSLDRMEELTLTYLN